MNNRERAMDILHCKSADRMPAVRFGCWQELLDEGAPRERSRRILPWASATAGRIIA